MKRILFISILWCCSLMARAQTATIRYLVDGVYTPTCCLPDTWCTRDINCNDGRFACQFSPPALTFSFTFSAPDPGGTIGPNPFRFKIDFLQNGNTIIFHQTYNVNSPNIGRGFNVTPLTNGLYQAKALFQKRTVVGWVDVGVFFSNVIRVNLCPPVVFTFCNSNVPISGNPFTTPLTQSQTWIASNNTTIVPSGASVKLDAHPANGFVQLNPGFEAQPGADFVAQALDGCGAAVPMRVSKDGLTVVAEGGATKQGAAKGTDHPAHGAYPNPTVGPILVRHGQNVKLLQVYNTLGKLMQSIVNKNGTMTRIDLSALPSGIYVLRADGAVLDKIVKQ